MDHLPTASDRRIYQCCPTCGGQLPSDAAWDEFTGTFVVDGHAATFTRLQRKIMSALWGSRNRGGYPDAISLADIVYSDEPAGGPDSMTSLYITMITMRKRLEKLGYTISGGQSKKREGFRLIKLEAANVGR